MIGFQQTEDEEMQRVVDVEEPLHERIDVRIRPALTIVQRQNRDRQHHGKLQDGVQQVVRKECVCKDRHV